MKLHTLTTIQLHIAAKKLNDALFHIEGRIQFAQMCQREAERTDDVEWYVSMCDFGAKMIKVQQRCERAYGLVVDELASREEQQVVIDDEPEFFAPSRREQRKEKKVRQQRATNNEVKRAREWHNEREQDWKIARRKDNRSWKEAL